VSLKKIKKHTNETAQAALQHKGLADFLTIIDISHDTTTVVVQDAAFGSYQADFKSLAKTTAFPLHPKRKHQLKMDAIRKKLIGTKINTLTVLDVFYGPDNGYKNRSFYIEYRGECGHIGIGTYAGLTKHKKTAQCSSCNHTIHGERSKIDGMLKKRTPTYIYWQTHKMSLPPQYQDFKFFKQEVGDKPYKRATLHMVDAKLSWVNLSITEDADLNLISTAIRQAFRHSTIYKAAIQAARIETERGPRYKCAFCSNLFKRTNIQVDHIDPIEPIDGSPLIKETLIDRIWTTKVQILDLSCHTKKSTAENALRRKYKKEKKNGI
jgi:hypothetical protein